MRDPAQSRRLLGTIALCAALLLVPVVALFVLVPSRSAPRPRSTESARPVAPAPRPSVVSAVVKPKEKAAPTPTAQPTDAPVGGRVLDPDGHPIAGAVVSCDHDRDHDPLMTKTDDDGHFTLAAEAAGCTATAQHDGFIASDPTELRAGDGNTLSLLAPGAIAGVVVDEQGKPMASCTVSIESFRPAGPPDTPGPTVSRTRVEDASGAFKLEGLPPGTYLLTAIVEGRPPVTSEQLSVDAGRTRDGVRLVVPRGGVLVGRVIDAESHDALAGTSVVLDTATLAGAPGIATSTDANGHYELAGVPAGPFSIRVAHPGYRTNVVTGLNTNGAPRLEHDVELNKGDGSTEMTGIGAFIAGTPRGIMVLGLVQGGPADQAGLQRTDRVLRIDGVDTDGMTVAEATQRLRGPDGSRVTLDVDRAGTGKMSITITRGTVVR